MAGCSVIQVYYRAEGLSQDILLARCYAAVRLLCIADGPDEVHLETVCKEEIAIKILFKLPTCSFNHLYIFFLVKY